MANKRVHSTCRIKSMYLIFPGPGGSDSTDHDKYCTALHNNIYWFKLMNCADVKVKRKDFENSVLYFYYRVFRTIRRTI